MRVVVDNEEAFEALRPLDIAAYLRSRGWTELASDDERVSYWEKTCRDSTYEVLAPKQSGWRDYARRVKSLVNTLGEAEDRSQLAIMHDISAVFYEIPQKITFTTDALEVVQEAGRILRERGPVDDFELLGPVVDLSRPSADSLYGVGVIVGSVQGQLRKVNVELWGRDWQAAHDALGKPTQLLLRCTGELLKSGNLFTLKNARDVGHVPAQ